MDESATLAKAEILGGLDVAIFASSIVMSVLIGLYFANKNKTMEDYMLGGRNQSLLPVSMSMMTSFISGLSIIGNPAEFYYQGFAYMTITIPQLVSVPVIALVLLPVFHRMGSVSVYEYLERRFHPLVKSLVSLCFMLQMTLYNAVVLFVPSLSLQTILGISPGVSIGAVGASCLIYSTFGGLKAIIWTDFFQAGLMYLSVVCIAIGGVIELGGLSRVLEMNKAAGRFDVNDYFAFDLNTRHTVFTIILGGLVCNVFVNGASQIQIQRALSLPSLRQAQWSMFLSGVFVILITASCLFLGLILTAAYSDCDPLASGQIDKPDSIIFHYLTSHLLEIPGLRGLFVAGIFAATLSTLSSFQNSMSALVIEDFIKPCLSHHNKPMGRRAENWLSRLVALAFGLTCIGLSFVVGRVSGLLQIAMTLYGALGGPFLGAFLLGMLTRFTNTIGIICGMGFGFGFGVYVQTYQTFYSAPLKPSMPVSVAGCQAFLNSTLPLVASSEPANTEPIIGGTKGLLGMSYFWLPVSVLVITVAIAMLVSILTGGLRQDVDEDYLVAWMHSKKILKRQEPLIVGKRYVHQ